MVQNRFYGSTVKNAAIILAAITAMSCKKEVSMPLAPVPEFTYAIQNNIPPSTVIF